MINARLSLTVAGKDLAAVPIMEDPAPSYVCLDRCRSRRTAVLADVRDAGKQKAVKRGGYDNQ